MEPVVQRSTVLHQPPKLPWKTIRATISASEISGRKTEVVPEAPPLPPTSSGLTTVDIVGDQIFKLVQAEKDWMETATWQDILNDHFNYGEGTIDDMPPKMTEVMLRRFPEECLKYPKLFPGLFPSPEPPQWWVERNTLQTPSDVASRDWDTKHPGTVRRVKWTLNNPTAEEVKTIDSYYPDRCSYLCFQEEIAPSTKTRHLEGFIKFRQPIQWKQLKALFPRAHLEKCKCTKDAPIIAYCTKTQEQCAPGAKYAGHGGRVPGTEPVIRGDTSEKAGQGVSQRLTEIVAKGQVDGNIDIDTLTLQEPMLAGRFDRTLRQAKHVIQKRLPDKPRFGHLIIGPAGIGKTSNIKRIYGEQNVYEKSGDGWNWEDYDGQSVIIIDEFHGNRDVSFSHPGIAIEQLNSLLDRRKTIGNIKYGKVVLNPEHIYILSNTSLEKCYPLEPPEVIAALTRRCDITVYDIQGNIISYTPMPERENKDLIMPGDSRFKNAVAQVPPPQQSLPEASTLTEEQKFLLMKGELSWRPDGTLYRRMKKSS